MPSSAIDPFKRRGLIYQYVNWKQRQKKCQPGFTSHKKDYHYQINLSINGFGVYVSSQFNNFDKSEIIIKNKICIGIQCFDNWIK